MFKNIIKTLLAKKIIEKLLARRNKRPPQA
jgi:hypothetical protein